MAAIGTIGKYERLDVLGHGTSGVVYLAWDTLLRRHVALKEIRAAGPEMERVLDEARVLDRLGRHPHIVQVHSVDQMGGAVLIDMELIRGANLADVLRDRGGPLAPPEAVRIATAVLEALAYAHERRIIHRDIKPANILIGRDGAVKLTDFGLAEALGSGSVAGGGGTYPYMAPEDFAENAESDYRSDLWAVGVLTYEMLTGRRPFQVAARTRDPFAWKRAITEEIPPPVRELCPALPVPFDSLFVRALARNKVDRFPSAVAFATALREAAAGLPAAVPEQPLPKPMPSIVTEGDSGAASEFVFSNGAAATDLDTMLLLCARNWHEARSALLDGRIEVFLRAVGEPYIADLAADLRTATGDADRRLREFLERSRGADRDEGTVVAPEGSRTVSPIRGGPPLLPSPLVGAPAAEHPAELQPLRPLGWRSPHILHPVWAVENSEGDAPSAGRWWAWPLLVTTLAPVAAMVSSGAVDVALAHGGIAFERVFLGWAASGFLASVLLLVGLEARFTRLTQTLCGVVAALGLVSTGALASLILAPAPHPSSLVRVTVLLIFPLAIVLVVASTLQRLWRLWAWVTLALALVLTLQFLQPPPARVVHSSHRFKGDRS